MANARERWRLLATFTFQKNDKNEGSEHGGVRTHQPHRPVSRVAPGNFGFVKMKDHLQEDDSSNPHQDQSTTAAATVPWGPTDSEYQLRAYSVPTPFGGVVEIVLRQRKAGSVSLADHQLSQRCGVDNTGVVCCWPAEEVMTRYCIQHPALFRGKRVIELGAGYGLAGLAVAACTGASEVVLTDGNPQVLDAIQHNVRLNAHLFGAMSVRVQPLLWGDDASLRAVKGPFDVIIAADCTFFKDYHTQLANTIKTLLTQAPSTSSAQTCQLEKPVNGKPVALTSSEVEQVASSTFNRDSQSKVGSNSGHEARMTTSSDIDMAARVGLEGSTDFGPSNQGSHRTVSEDRAVEAHDRIGTATERPVGLEKEHRIGKVCGGGEATGIAEDLNDGVSDNLETSEASEIESLDPCALLFNPQRGGTLDQFVDIARRAGLLALVRASFDTEVDRRNDELRSGERPEWLGYTEEHCRPLLLTLRPARHNC